MKIGMIGLGKMGANMTSRLLRGGHEVVAFDLNEDAIQKAEAEGAEGARTLAEVAEKLSSPRVVWVMVPAGKITESVISELGELLSEGDTIIDGGNTMYKDDIRRAAELAEKNIHYVDVGTSGGVWGLAEGYSMMIGGETEAVSRLSPILETLAPAADLGWGHVGPVGAGHFVKMVHNGIEYGLMEAYAEGFEIMHAKKDFGLDLHQVAEIWRHGSVVRSWLLDLTANALEGDQDLSDIAGYVSDSGEGRWTVFEAVDLDVPAPVITLSLLRRFSSRQDESYAAKVLSAMRNQFGGHAVKKAE
ncbi:MAG: decarboxylating 6-phosphogluconate dehydrogenase [Anaerolineales bacterium]|uniref:Decarboxylating 6-phosphogluconate dehydrogenase n=1 Tax=Candidatus Desulfolinea nitratireducens TaxID=2841698 RepID=A0A8J6NKR6_9CHLR|nr:decarboxylating 6-phosphogluconate dehydrogenase [Candidatus Desulfolinea nitratireducens]